MSERKVLNKYYPPDFDPAKIPRMKLPKNRQYTVRLMAPCNMRCKTCGEYIYKGKKFNARKEDVENEDYLGIRIYRFYIKCTRCLAEISFKTDPEATDYVIEAGATRNFMALKLAEEAAEREERERKEEEAGNPMKLLENRTKASKQEMELLEALEELRDLNQRQLKVDYDTMLDKYENVRKQKAKTQEEEDEAFIKSVFHSKQPIKRVLEDSDDSDEGTKIKKFHHVDKTTKATDVLVTNVEPKDLGSTSQEKDKWHRSLGTLSSNKGLLSNLVLIKPKAISEDKKKNEQSPPLCSNDGASAHSTSALTLLSAYSDSESD